MKPDAPVEREVRPASPRSPSPPARRRGLSRHDDTDDEWIETSPRKRSRARPPTPPSVVVPSPAPQVITAPPPPTPPPRVAPRPAAPRPAAPPAASTAPAPAAPPSPAVDERRRVASTHSRLLLLFKHKEMLKKEIIKKRGLLEKELGVEIQVKD